MNKSNKKNSKYRITEYICPTCGNPLPYKTNKCPFCKTFIKGKVLTESKEILKENSENS